MRDALAVVFELPARDQPNFVLGKLRDLVTLVVIGVVLMVSVAVSGFVSGFAETVLGWLGLGSGLGPLLQALTVLLGLAANALLFFAMFRLLAEPRDPTRSLWQGALLGAVGFEVLKRLSGLLLASTKGAAGLPGVRDRADPAGLDQLLLAGGALRRRLGAHLPRGPRAALPRARGPDPGPAVAAARAAPARTRRTRRRRAGAPAAGAGVRRGLPAFAAGAGTALALVALLRRTPEEDR